MIKWLKREFFGWFAGFKDYITGLDSCELCGNEWTDSTCSGCNKRICCMCESGYYADESLCHRCRHDITPEEEEEDRKLAAAQLDGDTE